LEQKKNKKEIDLVKKENISEKNKCSLSKHENNDAISYCQQCNIYMCNKCCQIHSELLSKHYVNNLNKDIKDVFTGLCKEKNHSMNLTYFCKNHNQLCCAACITKIRCKGNGKHKNCKIFYINKIKTSKKNKLDDNIKYLEELSSKLELSIRELKTLFKNIEDKKNNLKLEIQKIFTKIRSALNDREDKLLLEVDQKFNDLFFKEELIKESEKLPNKIKESIEKGKIINNEWDDNNKLSFLINDCLNIENNIKDIKEINKIINESNSNKGIVIELNYEKAEYHLLKYIKNFCNIYHYDKLSSKSKEMKNDNIKEDEFIPQKLKTSNSVRNLKEDYSKSEKRLLTEESEKKNHKKLKSLNSSDINNFK